MLGGGWERQGNHHSPHVTGACLLDGAVRLEGLMASFTPFLSFLFFDIGHFNLQENL